MCIDIDNHNETEDLDNLLNDLKEESNWVDKSANGWHFLFADDDRVPKINGDDSTKYKLFEIKKDPDGVNVCPSSYYDDKGVLKEYTMEKFINNNPRAVMSEKLLNKINNAIKSAQDHTQEEKRNKHNNEKYCNEELSEGYIELLKEAQGMNTKNGPRKDIPLIYARMCKSDEQRNKTVETLDEWCKVNHSSYHAKEWKAQWDYAVRKSIANPKPIGTIIDWCKKNNPEGYKRWKDTYADKEKSIKYLISTFSNRGVSKYFYKNTKENYVVIDGDWHVYNAETKQWKKLNEDNDMLIRIGDFMVEKFEKHKYKKKEILDQLNFKQDVTHTTDSQPSTSQPITTTPMEYKAKMDKAKMDKAEIEKYISRINNLICNVGSAVFLKGVVSIMKTEFVKENLIFDAAHDILSFKNGVYEILTDTLRERKYDDYLTKSLDIDYKPECDKEIQEWIKKEVFENNEELARWFGYAMTCSIEHKKNILFSYRAHSYRQIYII